jgi:hypothetical protein
VANDCDIDRDDGDSVFDSVDKGDGEIDALCELLDVSVLVNVNEPEDDRECELLDHIDRDADTERE